MTSRDLKGQGRDPDTKNAQYLENGWRWRLGYNKPPIGMVPGESNGHMTDDVT